MVLGVCRRVLRDSHAAEDAFQASFLVLFRRARFLDRRASVASWLYTVAYHAALRARADADRRHRHERQVVHMARTTSTPEEFWSDLQPVLDEELNRLPDKYRSAVVLRHLEGKTNDEAARLLRCPAGTVKSRLARARDLLRTRLTRRGISLSAGTLATVLAERATAAVPAGLGDATVNMVLSLAAGQAAGVAPAVGLAEGILKTMFVAKLKIATALLLAVGLVGLGVATCTRQALAQRQAEATASAATAAARSQSPRAAPAKETKAEENKAITVRARVLNPDGNPVPGARVAVLHWPKRFWQAQNVEELRLDVLAEAKADDQGRVRLKVPPVPAPPAALDIQPVQMAAAAKGYGLGLRSLDLKTDTAEVEVRLRPERVLRLRFIDLQGAPVRDLRIPSYAIVDKKAKPTGALMRPAQRLSLWPGTLITDAQGRCVLRGTGRGQTVWFLLHDDRFARMELEISADKKGGPEEITTALTPAQMVQGRVTYADTGKPVAGAEVGFQWTKSRTDKDGRYRLSPPMDQRYGPVYLHVRAPAGQPYVGMLKALEKPKGGAKLRADIALPRGVLVRGKVAETGSGKPVAGAVVYFFAQRGGNPYYQEYLAFGSVFTVPSKADGTFQIAVLPGPGWLVVEGPAPEYVPLDVGENQFNDGKPGGPRWYAHGLLRTGFKPTKDPQNVTINIRRGVTVRGKTVGPDGKPAAGVQSFSRLNTSAAMFIKYEVRGVAVPEGRFEFKGCDAEKAYPVVFLDERNGYGAVVQLSGKDAGDKPLIVRLARCGTAVARFVNAEGKPLAGYRPVVEMLMTPGPHRYDFAATTKRGTLAADSVDLSNVYPRRYQLNNRADAKGRYSFVALVPGVTYRIWWQAKNGITVRDFSVKSGEAVDLKDITVPQPQ
jgi:RNA polymerase sigma factor (sigma-70 family)